MAVCLGASCAVPTQAPPSPAFPSKPVRIILDVGLDVDDTHYHGSTWSQDTGAILPFQCRPTLEGVVGPLAKRHQHFPGYTVHLADEASYIDYTLQRDLASQGYHGTSGSRRFI
jgi:hypothetical protein